MLVFPNAKVNLGLEVLRKRPDGYRDIDTVMVPVPLSDALEFVPSARGEDRWHLSGMEIPGAGGPETVIKALAIVREKADIPPLDIYLHKAIPMGAGMGGGSSDGAFMLRALNNHFALGLAAGELEALAARIGSDCPFFIGNIPSRATGRGEVLTPLPLDLSGWHILMVFPGVHISTAVAYSHILPGEPDALPHEVVTGLPVQEWKHHLRNRFEAYAFATYPAIRSVRDGLYTAGAAYAAMTGSGSAVFGLFAEADVATAAHAAQGYRYHLGEF